MAVEEERPAAARPQEPAEPDEARDRRRGRVVRCARRCPSRGAAHQQHDRRGLARRASDRRGGARARARRRGGRAPRSGRRSGRGGSRSGSGRRGAARSGSVHRTRSAIRRELRHEGGARYLQLTLQAMARSEETIAAVKQHAPAIRNSVLFKLSGYELEVLNTQAGKEQLRHELLAAANEILAEERGRASHRRALLHEPRRPVAHCDGRESTTGAAAPRADITGAEVDALLVKNASQAPRSVRRSPTISSRRDRIVRGRMPVLDRLNERWVTDFERKLGELIRQPLEVTLQEVQLAPYGDWLAALPVPTSFNLYTVKPWTRNALVAVDGKLLFALVNGYYGGTRATHEADARNADADRAAAQQDRDRDARRAVPPRSVARCDARFPARAERSQRELPEHGDAERNRRRDTRRGDA